MRRLFLELQLRLILVEDLLSPLLQRMWPLRRHLLRLRLRLRLRLDRSQRLLRAGDEHVAAREDERRHSHDTGAAQRRCVLRARRRSLPVRRPRPPAAVVAAKGGSGAAHQECGRRGAQVRGDTPCTSRLYCAPQRVRSPALAVAQLQPPLLRVVPPALALESSNK